MEDFVKKNKTALMVSAGAVLALGAFGFLWRRRKHSSTIDAHGYFLDQKFNENV